MAIYLNATGLQGHATHRSMVIPILTGGTATNWVFSNQSWMGVGGIEDRNNGQIWDNGTFDPAPTGFSEEIWVHMYGNTQSSGTAVTYGRCVDRASDETYFTDFALAQGWYGGTNLIGFGIKLTTTSSGHAPRDRGLGFSVKSSGSGSAVICTIMLEQRILYA